MATATAAVVVLEVDGMQFLDAGLFCGGDGVLGRWDSGLFGGGRVFLWKGAGVQHVGERLEEAALGVFEDLVLVGGCGFGSDGLLVGASVAQWG